MKGKMVRFGDFVNTDWLQTAVFSGSKSSASSATNPQIQDGVRIPEMLVSFMTIFC